MIGQNLPSEQGRDEQYMVKKNLSRFVEPDINNFTAKAQLSNECQVSRNLSNISSNLNNVSNNAKVGSGQNTRIIPENVCVNATVLDKKQGPYEKFKYPRIDPPLSEAGKLEIPNIDSLEYVVNLMAGKLQPDLKEIWDEIAGRDVSIPEISKSGMQLTGYDIKNQCAIYKKAREKAKYVSSLTDKVTTHETSVQGDPPTDSKIFASQVSPTDVVNFRNPTDGPLFQMLLECGYDQQSFYDSLFSLLYKNKSELLTLLNQIETNLICKKHRKKLIKFKKILESGKKTNQYKLNYYLKFISRTVQQRRKVCNNIKIRSLNTAEECSDCPEIFLTLGNSSEIWTGLLDTGAQSSLIPWSILDKLGYTEKDIKKTNHELNLESTTGVVRNAIVGSISLPAYILLKKQFTDGSRRFGRTTITFLVASPEVSLSRIIIGTPWLKCSQVQLHLYEKTDIVKARLKCENSTHLCSLQLKTIHNLKMTSKKEITEADSSAIFHINSFFLQDNISLKVHDRTNVELPKTIHLKNKFAISRQQGFPVILNRPGLEIPLRTKKDFNKLTVHLSLLPDPVVSASSAEVFTQDPSTPPPQVGSNSEIIPHECIRDAATFVSLPQELRDSLQGGHDKTVRVHSADIPENTMCKICHVFTNVCSCKRQCKVCLDWSEFDTSCQCTQDYVSALKARIEKNFTNESDVVTEDEQSDISALIDDRFDAFNLAPPEISPTVDLTHISDPKAREIVEKLISTHDKSFSTHRFDVGHFLGFEAHLDCIPGSSVIERERVMKPSVKEDLKPIIEDLLSAGIIRKATTQGPFLSNSHGVSKPEKGVHIAGRADLHILKQTGKDTNHSRLTLDLRNLNDHAVTRPKINLPSYEKLVAVFKNKHITVADLTSMYWSIQTSYDTQHLSNFYYDNHVYTFCCLPMGWVNACFIGQSATELAYSQETMLEFLKFKGWQLNSVEWPFSKISEILIVYMDDLCCFSPSDIPNHVEIHGNVIEFLLWATARWGFKIGPNKFSAFMKEFKFLGHYFKVDKACTAIPPARLQAIKNFRTPRSCAETLSRLSVIAYHRRYVPAMKLCAVPLQQMAMTGVFEWKEVHQRAWKALLLLSSLEFESNVVDKSRPLFLASDASQISVGWVLYQIVLGEIKIINLDGKILKSSDRRKPAAVRESLGVMFALISNETAIKGHPQQTLLLTDCIGLSCILRSKETNEKMLEYALYISTFRDLHVKYTVGSSLFLADLITRQYNRVELCNDRNKISEVWSHFSPPLKKKYVGAVLTPAMLTDLLISSPNAEYIDCFNKRQWYDQSLSRYHNKDDSPITSVDPIPVELEFLASLYSGFNGAKLTAQQFQELESSLRNVPAQSLAKRIPSNGNLNELRRTLFKLDIHKDLVEILRRKYFPDQYFDKKKVKAVDHLDQLDLPTEVARVVREAWQSAGLSPSTEGTQLIKKSDTQTRVCTVQFSPDKESSLVHTADPVLLTSGCDGQSQTFSEFLDKFQQNNVSETELLRMFNVDETELRKVLQPAAKIFLQFFYFIKTGRILEHGDGAVILRDELSKMDLDGIFTDKQLPLSTLLKLLVNIVDHLVDNQYFFFKNVIRIPYNYDPMNNFEIRYNSDDLAFEIFALHDIQLENYQSIRYEFQFTFVVNQLVSFEQNPNLDVLAIDCAQPVPPYYEFVELIFHSLVRENFILRAGTKLGKWKILSLQNKNRFVPLRVPKDLLSECTKANSALKTFNSRKNLSNRLSRLLMLKKNHIQCENENKLHSAKSRQFYVAAIVDQAGVQEQFLPKSKRNTPKFPFG